MKSESATNDNLMLERMMYQYKLILLGDIAVGKTSILSRFINNSFSQVYKCNVGVDFRAKTIYIDDRTGADLNIWDTCGEERFRGVSRQYYQDSNGILLVFDLTNHLSFEGLQSWFDDIYNFAIPGIDIALLGNKSDDIENRAVKMEEIKEMISDKVNCSYYEVSAKTGNNVTIAFEELAKKLNAKMCSEAYLKSNESSISQSIQIKANLSKIKRKEREIEKKSSCC